MFVAEQDWDNLGLALDDARRRTLRITNPLSEEFPLLRTTLLPGLLRTLARNVARSQGDVGLFETGSVFLPAADGPSTAAGSRRRPGADCR